MYEAAGCAADTCGGGFAVPNRTSKVVAFVDDVPLTSVGKIDKVKLREEFWAGKRRRVH